MKTRLNQLEQNIEEGILKRGSAYFNEGCVTQLTEISDGTYEAVVFEQKEYTVSFTVKNNVVEENYCDCLYRQGPVCKHAVAAIMCKQEDFPPSVNNSQELLKNPKTTTTLQIQIPANTVWHEELQAYLIDNSENNPLFRNNFMTAFGHISKDRSKQFYQKQIQSILHSVAKTDKFIHDADLPKVVKAIKPYIAYSESSFTNKHYINTIYICTATLEEMTAALAFTDDSSGELGAFIHIAIEMLLKTSTKVLPEAVRQTFYDSCLAAFTQNLFAGWDWHLDLMEMAINLAKTNAEFDIILQALNTVKTRYENERAQALKLSLIRKFKSPAQVRSFIQEHLFNPHIRRKEIVRALENQNYDSATKILEFGIQCDQQTRPALVIEWNHWLLKIAKAKNDAPDIIKHARFGLLNDFNETSDYFLILKKHISFDVWPIFLEGLLQEMTTRTRWFYPQLIQKILATAAHTTRQ